jgi:hypothetical protein
MGRSPHAPCASEWGWVQPDDSIERPLCVSPLSVPKRGRRGGVRFLLRLFPKWGLCVTKD